MWYFAEVHTKGLCVMLTDSLHVSHQRGSKVFTSCVLQCRGCGALQLTRRHSVAELQHGVAGCVPASRGIHSTLSVCRGYNQTPPGHAAVT